MKQTSRETHKGFGKTTTVTVGQEAYIGHCYAGGWTTFFGERATLKLITKSYLIFQTESGAVIKTLADNICQTVGKRETVLLSKPEDFVKSEIQ